MRKLKEQIIASAARSGEGHIPSCLSVLDILWTLYDQVMEISPQSIKDENRDRFILSKGHASIGLYVVLAKKGFITEDDLIAFGSYNSILGGHPDCNKIPGVEASTGSLGHGLPMAVGMALGLKIKRINDSRVFCLIGDGEANEGTIWEAMLLAAHHKLNNLYCIVDYNHSTDRAVSVEDIAKKFTSFNWETRVVDGHNQMELKEILSTPANKSPVAIIASTIKGKGVKIMENNPAWHHRIPKADELSLIMQDIN